MNFSSVRLQLRRRRWEIEALKAEGMYLRVTVRSMLLFVLETGFLSVSTLEGYMWRAAAMVTSILTAVRKQSWSSRSAIPATWDTEAGGLRVNGTLSQRVKRTEGAGLRVQLGGRRYGWPVWGLGFKLHYHTRKTN